MSIQSYNSTVCVVSENALPHIMNKHKVEKVKGCVIDLP